jgi:hypothetical protein
MTAAMAISEERVDAAKASPRSRHAELLVLCARLGFNP